MSDSTSGMYLGTATHRDVDLSLASTSTITIFSCASMNYKCKIILRTSVISEHDRENKP